MMRPLRSCFFIFLWMLVSLSGCVRPTTAQTFDDAKFERLVAKIESDALELAKKVEEVYANRCDPKHLFDCGEGSYDHCLSALPDQTCPGGPDLDTPECSSGGDGSCSLLYSYSASSVVIPRALARGTDANPTDPQVIESICFSKDLDEYFVTKREQDRAFWAEFGQSPSSMYFGSVSGSFRLYPARMYSKCNEYDPRVRPWYVAASAGPKNIVLVLDKSGSMRGQRMIMMKEAAKRIVQTATIADRIVLVAFNSGAETITDEGYVFIASEENKQRLSEEIDKLEAGGGTNFYAAFESVFEVMNRSADQEFTVNCNTAVLFLTDGEMTEPRDITEQFVLDFVEKGIAELSERLRNPVYLFTYSIPGLDTDIESFPSELACAVETGVYANIAFEEDIVESLSEYYKFFALGLGSGANEEFVAWVEPYKWIPGDVMGTTVSVPVYDRSKQPHLFLGVVGIDFTLDALDAALGVTNSSNDESFRRVVLRSTARCPKLEFTTCELESYRLQGTAGESALCTNNCTAGDFVQIAEQECPGTSDYPINLWKNVENKGKRFEEITCCVVGENVPNLQCAGIMASEDVQRQTDNHGLIIGLAVAGAVIVFGAVVAILVRIRKSQSDGTKEGTTGTSNLPPLPTPMAPPATVAQPINDNTL